ncbi:MAG: EAL domain-containing protein [Gammaproteobacteria bacterium]|nr:EAL domain-containing protein [Gammaproteobacteria bacterium]
MIEQKQLQTARILLFDDDAVNLYGLKKILNGRGFKEIFSIMPNQNIDQCLRDTAPDLILFNVDLKSVNALNVLKNLTERLNLGGVPILALSRQRETEKMEQVLKLGAKDYLVVPTHEIKIICRVQILLEHYFLTKSICSHRAIEAAEISVVAEKEKDSCVNTSGELHQQISCGDNAGLTGNENSTQLYHKITDSLQALKYTKQSLAVLLFSFENFGDICKTLGSESADTILGMTLQRLRDTVHKISLDSPIEGQSGHFVARFYGSKFLIVLRGLSSEEKAVLLAHRILSALALPYELPGLVLEITAQIGIALAPRHSTEVDSLFRQADVALYKARQSGRPVVVYSADIDHYDPLRLALISDLRKAINTNELFLVYQPKINIKTGCVSGVEALLRWMHPVHGFIPPNDFIPLAEQNSVIKPLTVWVMNTAMRQSVEFSGSAIDIPIAVNISATCLRDDCLVGYTKMLLEKNDIAPDRMIMEITESAMMRDPSLGLNVLHRLNNMGVQISIDDYGTGYSSLAYLKRLPVNEMKIDRAFIKDMANDEDDKLIVGTTIEMGHKFGLRVIAEGVEDSQTVTLLKEMNCDQVQGYYYGRPMPIDELYDWIAERKKVI